VLKTTMVRYGAIIQKPSRRHESGKAKTRSFEFLTCSDLNTCCGGPGAVVSMKQT
jgi:hypothetical protein